MLSAFDKFLLFISKPSKMQLLAERVENQKLKQAAEIEAARLKEWNLLVFDQANKGANGEQLQAMLSCALRGMTVTEVLNFQRSKIPQEIQK